MTLHQKTYSILLGSLCMLFTACGSPSQNIYETRFFSSEYSPNWYVVDEFNSLRLEKDPIVNFYLEEGEKINSYSIVYEELEIDINDKNLFIESHINSAKEISGYEELEIKKITLSGFKSKIHNFTITDSEKSIEYIQSFLYSGRASYIISAAVEGNFSSDTRNNIESMMRSFTIKEDKEE